MRNARILTGLLLDSVRSARVVIGPISKSLFPHKTSGEPPTLLNNLCTVFLESLLLGTCSSQSLRTMLAIRAIAAPVQRQTWRAAPRAAVALSFHVRAQSCSLEKFGDTDKDLANITTQLRRTSDSTPPKKTRSPSLRERRMPM